MPNNLTRIEMNKGPLKSWKMFLSIGPSSTWPKHLIKSGSITLKRFTNYDLIACQPQRKKDTRKQRAEQLELLRRQLKNTVKFKVTNRKPQIEGKLFLAWAVDKVIEIPWSSST